MKRNVKPNRQKLRLPHLCINWSLLSSPFCVIRSLSNWGRLNNLRENRGLLKLLKPTCKLWPWNRSRAWFVMPKLAWGSFCCPCFLLSVRGWQGPRAAKPWHQTFTLDPGRHLCYWLCLICLQRDGVRVDRIFLRNWERNPTVTWADSNVGEYLDSKRYSDS